MVKMLAKFADFKTRKELAEGLVLSKINYCISLWGTTNVEIMRQLQVLQNDVVRTVFGVGRRRFQEITPLFKKLKWLKVTETLQYHDVISLNTIIKYHTPQVRHNHNTRSTTKAYEVIDDMLKKSLFLPRWAWKDIYRNHVGGWPVKDRTTNVLMYLEALCDAGKNY